MCGNWKNWLLAILIGEEAVEASGIFFKLSLASKLCVQKVLYNQLSDFIREISFWTVGMAMLSSVYSQFTNATMAGKIQYIVWCLWYYS